jgi:hypothetical protein
MHINRRLALTLTVASLAGASIPRLAVGQEQVLGRLLKASEAEQTSWIDSHLRAGMPPSDEFIMLILNKSSVTLPRIEQKIEEVLRSPSPSECFSVGSVDPQEFVHRAALAIVEAGNEEALKQAGKLIRIDDKQFGWMVGRIFLKARSLRNPFVVAYHGFESGDPGIVSRIAPWFESQFDQAESILRQANTDVDRVQLKRAWAEAIAEKYGAVPTERQWATDPLASRLKPARIASLHDEMFQAITEALQKRPNRQ